ncbi:hypothetical protein KAR26_00360 [Candidatus Parcubacteria bacterium]|nr:hypothetical protein [Candidatus Parcubacteria bacterium]
MRKLIIFIILLSVIVGITGYYYYSKNIYSRDTLKLEILSSDKAELAQEVEYIIKYKNNGNIRLEEPKLIFEYPKYSLVEGGVLRQEIGSEKLGEAIYPGEEKIIRFKGRLLGKEGEIKEAKAWLSYRPKDLTARYESDTTFSTVIEKVPLVFEFDLPSKIESGKNIQFRLNYSSNIDYPLSDLRCIVEYPSGFEFSRSVPESMEQTEWEIPLLNRAEGGRIEIWGSLSGELKEQKNFKAKLGVWQEGEFILLKEITKGVEIIEPSLYISQQINGNPEYVANPGDMLHYEISFRNIGEETMMDLAMIIKLEGEAFDFYSIKAPEGKFQLGDNSIIWDGSEIPKLRFLDGQEQGKVEFWINLKDEWGVGSIQDKEPLVKNKIYLSQARKEFATKINSKLVINQKGYFNDDVFGNNGPIPPKVDSLTTYTITWQIENYHNELKNVKVKAVLPENVRLTGKISPEEESSSFAFDSQSREIVWQVDDLEIGAGVFSQNKTCIFQVALVPTQSQRGSTAILVNEVEIFGEDQWTEHIISITAEAIDTTLPDDETISIEQGIIQ